MDDAKRLRALVEHLRDRLPQAREMVAGPDRRATYEGLVRVARGLTALLWLRQRTLPGRGETEGRLLEIIQQDTDAGDITLRTVACSMWLLSILEGEIDA